MASKEATKKTHQQIDFLARLWRTLSPTENYPIMRKLAIFSLCGFVRYLRPLFTVQLHQTRPSESNTDATKSHDLSAATRSVYMQCRSAYHCPPPSPHAVRTANRQLAAVDRRPPPPHKTPTHTFHCGEPTEHHGDQTRKKTHDTSQITPFISACAVVVVMPVCVWLTTTSQTTTTKTTPQLARTENCQPNTIIIALCVTDTNPRQKKPPHIRHQRRATLCRRQTAKLRVFCERTHARTHTLAKQHMGEGSASGEL